MHEPFSRKKFIFNSKIDSNYLFSLYEDDYAYVEEIFKTTLDQLNTVVPEIPRAFANNDILEVRKSVHKIKPAFGFTGFLETEKCCKDFEDACTEQRTSEDLTALYNRFWLVLSDTMRLMHNQYDQLKEYNKI